MSRIIFFFTVSLFLSLPALSSANKQSLAPTEVLSDSSIIKRGGVNAIKISFAIPVHYVSHNPVKRGQELSIQLRFNKREVPDVSQLPLLQSMTPHADAAVPVEEILYTTENSIPTLTIKFTRVMDFSVSQVMGITSLLVFLPETFNGPESAEPEPDKAQPKAGSAPDMMAMTPERLDAIYRNGQRALREGDNPAAIRIFTSLLSLEKHQHTEVSLELLALARQRNGQIAHAKALYEEYLEKYPKSKNNDRIKQRLADLDQERSQPQQPLKKSEETRKSKLVGSSFANASLAQYYNFAHVDSKQQGAQVQARSIDTQVTFNHRYRTSAFDWRNVFVGGIEQDILKDKTRGFEVGKLYSKYKSAMSGVYSSVGRQQSNVPGVIGRYDGFSLGADASEHTRTNMVVGYPVDIANKGTIDTSKRFRVFNVEFIELWKGGSISPFVATQTTDGFESRAAFGAESRYVHDSGDIYLLLEYDRIFSELTSAIFQGKYLIGKHSHVSLALDNIKRIDLEQSLSAFTTQEAKDKFSYEDLKVFAEGKTGATESIRMEYGHEFSDVLNINVSYAHSNEASLDLRDINNNSLFDPTVEQLYAALRFEDRVTNNDFNILVLTSQTFHPQDDSHLTFQKTTSDHYKVQRISLDYRRPYGGPTLRINTRIQYSTRDSDNGSGFSEIKPSVKLDHRLTKTVRLYTEASLGFRQESNLQTGTLQANDSTQFIFYGGYVWDF